MKYRGTLLLLVVSLILGGWYLLVIRPQAEIKKQAHEFERRFFRADTREIVSIRVENREGAVEISQGPQGWMIQHPRNYRPDEGVLKKLLDTIASGRLTKVVGDAGQLSQFGFDQPVLSLSLGLRTGSDVLVIGQKNPADTGYYAYSASLGKIFLVNKELPNNLYLCLYDLREKRLYPFNVEQVGTIVIRRGSEVIELAHSNDGWLMRSPFKTRASDEEVSGFLKTLTQQKAEGYITWKEKLGELPQRAHVQLLDRAGQSLVNSDIYYWGTGEGEGIVVHEPGSAEAARTRRDFWEQLHVESSVLLERRLFAGDPSRLTRVRVVTDSEQIMIERHGNRWLKNGQTLPPARVDRVLAILMNWKGEKRLPARPVSAKPRTTIEVDSGSTVQQLMVYPVDMTKDVTSPGATVEVYPGKPERATVVYWLANATALNGHILVGSHDIERFIDQLRQLK